MTSKLRPRDLLVMRHVAEFPGRSEITIGCHLFGPRGRADAKARGTLRRLERLDLVDRVTGPGLRGQWEITDKGLEALKHERIVEPVEVGDKL